MRCVVFLNQRIAGCVMGLMLVGWATADLPGDDVPWPRLAVESVVREPVALARLGDTDRIVIANRRSRALSIMDLATGRIAAEFRVPGEPVDVVRGTNAASVWIADRVGRRVIEAQDDGEHLFPRREIALDGEPNRIALSEPGDRLAVASTWEHAVRVVDLTVAPPSVTVVPLSFPPGELLWLEEDRLLVADAFGGRLAVVGPAGTDTKETRWQPLFTHEFHAHNLRGLSRTVDGHGVRLAHQVLHGDAPTTPESIESGALLENVVRTIPVERLFSAVTEGDSELSPDVVIRLGGAEQGAADPVATLPISPERFVTLLGGTGELCVHDGLGREFSRHAVGSGPVAWLVLPDRGELVVLSRFSETLTVFDLTQEQVVRTVTLGERPPLTPAERGERLFFDARLSHRGWLSCHSCHPQGHSSGDLADTFADDSYGTPKRVLSLLGTRDNNPWGWNGAFRELHTQVSQSIFSSMQGERLPAPKVNDLVAFLHTLDAPPVVSSTDEASVARRKRGQQVFEQQGCARCHVPPLTYTSDGLFDVGLQDEQGLRKFNPPSLRGLRHQRRHFHDGRATTLRGVLEEEAHQLQESLPPDELEDLIAFLLSL